MDRQTFIINELAIELANLKIELAGVKADYKKLSEKYEEKELSEKHDEKEGAEHGN